MSGNDKCFPSFEMERKYSFSQVNIPNPPYDRGTYYLPSHHNSIAGGSLVNCNVGGGSSISVMVIFLDQFNGKSLN